MKKRINPKFEMGKDKPIIDDIGYPLIEVEPFKYIDISRVDDLLVHIMEEHMEGRLNIPTLSSILGIIYYSIIDYPITTERELKRINEIIVKMNSIRKLLLLQPFNIRTYPEYMYEVIRWTDISISE